VSIRVESGENILHLLGVLFLVLHLRQSANIQSLSLRLIDHIVGASESGTGGSLLSALVALELLAIVARRASPVRPLLETRAAVSIALLSRLAWTDLDLTAAEGSPERGEGALSSCSLDKVHKAVARVAGAHGVDRDVDVLNVVEAIGDEELFNVLRLEHVVEVTCLDRSVFGRIR
jgi:hypothetical protein